MQDRLTRRDALAAMGFFATGVASRPAASAPGSAGAAAGQLKTSVISWQDDYYHGWPTMTRLPSGRLMLVYSGGRESRVCPFGRVEMMQSDDDGKTWTFPRVVLDSAIDDRDAGIVETAKGTLLVTTFTSLAYETDCKESY